MTRREAWLTAGAVFVVAIAVRVLAALAITFPVPEDTAYYVAVARNLIEGHGLISDALWSYQTPPLVVPRAAFEVWLPLPTFLDALPMALLGATFRATQVSAVLVGALVPVLAWRLAADVAEERGLPRGRARTLTLGAGLVACAYGPLAVYGALPDSTMPFAALALAACLLMARILRDPRDARPRDVRLVGLGVLLGLGALARNEALWVALTWALLAWFATGHPAGDPGGLRGGPGRPTPAAPKLERRTRLRLIAIPAVVALVIYVPWMVRDWLAFGSPMPGQTLANALSVNGFDIFAWQDRPTLARYLAQGVGGLVGARVEGFRHNLVDVLLVPAVPAGPIGLVALPWQGRGGALRPLLVLSVLTLAATTLFFPVATTWGTFLHAAGPVQVLLLMSCLLWLDALIVRVGRRRGWTRPVAWLGPVLVAATAVPVLVVSVASIAGVATDAQARYATLAERLTAAGLSPSRAAPIIVDFPIWTAWSMRVPTLGLPDESPSSVLDLARHFDAHVLVVSNTHGIWPAVLTQGGPDAACFVPLDLAAGANSAESRSITGAVGGEGSAGAAPDPLADTHAYRIDCGS